MLSCSFSSDTRPSPAAGHAVVAEPAAELRSVLLNDQSWLHSSPHGSPHSVAELK